MANVNVTDWRNVAIWVVGGVVVLLIIAWLAGAFEGSPEAPTTGAPQPETTSPQPETTQPGTQEPAQQQ